jgi:hypothetical protein
MKLDASMAGWGSGVEVVQVSEANFSAVQPSFTEARKNNKPFKSLLRAMSLRGCQRKQSQERGQRSSDREGLRQKSELVVTRARSGG